MNNSEKLAQEFADDLFGSYDRLVCSREGEDEGRAGWSKQPVVDNLERLITEARAFPSEADKKLFVALKESVVELCSRIADGRKCVNDATGYTFERAYVMAEKQADRVRAVLAEMEGTQ